MSVPSLPSRAGQRLDACETTSWMPGALVRTLARIFNPLPNRSEWVDQGERLEKSLVHRSKEPEADGDSVRQGELEYDGHNG